jgi:thioredoxin 1
MNFKRILSAVAIISLVLLASYLFAQKGVNNGEVCPVPPVIKQISQQQSPGTQEKIKENTTGIKVTFVELGSIGCGPCDAMRPILDEIEKEYEGQVLVRFWDVKSLLGRPYADKYKVQLIPTQVFLDKDGIEYYRHVGFFEKAEIIKVLQMQGVE